MSENYLRQEFVIWCRMQTQNRDLIATFSEMISLLEICDLQSGQMQSFR